MCREGKGMWRGWPVGVEVALGGGGGYGGRDRVVWSLQL